jgi:protein O-GlcNAc transferase
MSRKLETFTITMVSCVLLFSGCRRSDSPRVSQNLRTAADVRKNELLHQLDQKWENPAAHYELGQLYHAEGDWSKAERCYNTAIGFNPAYRDAQAALAKLQFDKGDRSKGEFTANMYMTQAASSAEQLLALGVAFEKQLLDDYALKCYQDALKIAPDAYKVSRQLGYYYLNKNKKDLAKEYFISSFNLNSNQPDVAGELGRLGVAVRIPEAPPSQNLSLPVRPPTRP